MFAAALADHRDNIAARELPQVANVAIQAYLTLRHSVRLACRWADIISRRFLHTSRRSLECLHD
jgi:hypothetical protein